MIPLVYGVVQPFIALQANQFGVQPRRQGPGDFGLADARLALQEEGTLELQSQENGYGKPTVGDVELVLQQVLNVVDGLGEVDGGGQGGLSNEPD